MSEHSPAGTSGTGRCLRELLLKPGEKDPDPASMALAGSPSGTPPPPFPAGAGFSSLVYQMRQEIS